MKWEQYRKLIAAAVGSTVTAALGIWGPDTKVGQALIVLSAILTGLGVYGAKNAPAPPASDA